jgi:ABC-2 type transport system ATP-binding protein
VPPGTIFGLLGPNGAGKSTTVRILTTLSRPDSGGARVAGIDVLAEPVRVRHAIGVVAQKHGIDPEATGRENLVLQGEFYAITGGDLRRRVTEALERFGLVDAADRQAKTFSGGMQRRLDLAMGLIHRPQVLFLDEPTTGLDPEARADIWHEIERLARDELMTILLTTHYMEEADRLASQLAIVDRGRIVVQGTPDELKSELQGDAIQVELVDAHDAAARLALADVSGVGDASLDGRTLHARARDGAAAIPSVLAALDAHGVKAASVTLARPSLDDVYLRHAGRSFHRADAEHEAVAA